MSAHIAPVTIIYINSYDFPHAVAELRQCTQEGGVWVLRDVWRR